MSPWMDNIAQEYHVPLLNFSVFSAAAYTFFTPVHLVGDRKRKPSITYPGSLTSAPEWVDFPSSLAYRSFDAVGVYNGFFKCNASGMSDVERVAKTLKCMPRTTRRQDGGYAAARFFRPTSSTLSGFQMNEMDNCRQTKVQKFEEFVDRHLKPDLEQKWIVAVLFIVPVYATESMAHGLELSGLSFLWALRKPDWAVDDVDALPSGFVERTHGRGVFGHCLVVLPLIIDQPWNARILVDKGLAVELERREDGSFTRDDIANALRLAMVSVRGW
ncbi:hypothetical protein Dsin_026053 [Dipteronia sinensis]|uniref:Uncharacterized protein n=1 Tax=Dipteronia sinensis TaxID=43782 RepID=A0AAD9ZYL3_9ROSI|nr:hypothetical protein Dsin_026053 [Dipteronia sinensis]